MNRTALASALLLVTAGLAAPPSAAAAAPRRAARLQFQKVTLNDLPGEPMTSPCCPTGACCTPPAPARSGCTTRHRAEHARRRAPGLPARRGRPAEHRDRPELRAEQLGLPLLLAAAEHAGRRPGDADGQRGRRARAPARRRTSRRSRATSSCRASSRPATRSTSAPSRRSSRCRSTAASAATSAATSSSTARATCYLSTGDDTNPFESDGYTPIDERPDRNPAFDAQRSAGQHQRPARQGAAHHGRRPAAATRSRRATCSGRARRRPGPRSTRWACATRSGSRSTASTGELYVADYSPDAERAEPAARARRARQVDDRHASRQLRLAVLRDRRAAVPSTTTSPPASRARRSTARAGQRLAAQHRPADCRRSTQPDVWYSYARVGRVPGARAPAASARWAARRTSSTPRQPRRATRRPGRRTTTACRCSTSGRATTSRSSARPPTAT